MSRLGGDTSWKITPIRQVVLHTPRGSIISIHLKSQSRGRVGRGGLVRVSFLQYFQALNFYVKIMKFLKISLWFKLGDGAEKKIQKENSVTKKGVT